MDSKMDCELLATITAAINMQNSCRSSKLVIRSFRRIPLASPVWNTTGRVERMTRNLDSNN